MSIVLASHTEPVEEMKAVMEAAGLQASVNDPNTPPVEVTDPAKPSEQPEKPGETPAAKSGGESDPAPEAGEKPQEKQAKPADHMSRGNFKSKLAKLEERNARLADEAEAERNEKARLRKQFEDVQAELAAFKKPVEVEAKEPSGPVKPKRPTKTEYDFDEDKYEAALEKYDEDLSTYHSAVAEKKVEDRLAQVDAQRKQEAQAAEVDRAQAVFAARMTEGLKDIPGLSERLDQWEGDVDLPRLVEQYMIRNAKKPADLMNFFANDAIDNDAVELHRIAGLSDVEQVQELTLLEARLVREREEKTAKPDPVATVADATPPVTPPARPKPVARPPVEPTIEPLGSRSSGAVQSLEKAKGNNAEYFRLRAAGINR